ncbi:MAG: hypothetical protein OEN50_14665 [Deltaproteobacteria bacterium]|nr:hypothetical protein [Deltaproteobacteria bacterium]
MEQSVSLYPALLSFLSFGAVLVLQRSQNQVVKTLWLVSAKEAYESHAFQEFHRIKCEIGEGTKYFVLLEEDPDSPMHYRIELPSGRRDIIMKEWVDLAVRRNILIDIDPETRSKQQAKINADRRARQIRAKGWPLHIGKLVIDGKIAIQMTREQVMLAWGKPDQINNSEADVGVYEQWLYGSTCLYFEGGILQSYHERPEALIH